MQSRSLPPIAEAEPAPLRADARRNYEQLIAAAEAAFAEHGADASLDDIARRAGVGIGTLYRHFPTRGALMAKVLDEGTAAMNARADQLLSVSPPSAALTTWLEALIAHVTTFSGLSRMLAASLSTTDTKLGCACHAIAVAGNRLLARAQQAGEIRADATIKDILLAVHAAVWAAEQAADPVVATRLLALTLDGLRAGAPATTGSASAARPAARARSSGRSRGAEPRRRPR